MVALLLEHLLKSVPEDTKERVDKTRQRVHTAIREMVRSGTGLLLNRQDAHREHTTRKKVISVPIILVPGLPIKLRDLNFEGVNKLALIISPYRRELEKAKAGLSGASPLLKELAANKQGEELLGSSADPFTPALNLIEALLEKIEESDPVEKILEVNEDVLGAYWYNSHFPANSKMSLFYEDPMNGRIEIYWGLIGLVSGMLGTSIEALAAVVLIHEIVHAYTHMGADIDGVCWDSRWFADSEHTLKEGLAQYYTHYITQRVDSQIPKTHEAYKELLSRQPDAYKVHLEWVESSQPEEVRLAMIAIRRKEKGTLGEFKQKLTEATVQLAGKPLARK